MGVAPFFCYGSSFSEIVFFQFLVLYFLVLIKTKLLKQVSRLKLSHKLTHDFQTFFFDSNWSKIGFLIETGKILLDSSKKRSLLKIGKWNPIENGLG